MIEKMARKTGQTLVFSSKKVIVRQTAFSRIDTVAYGLLGFQFASFEGGGFQRLGKS
jgi:hypothetical protein